MLPVEPDCLDSHRSRAFYVTRDGISDVDDYCSGKNVIGSSVVGGLKTTAILGEREQVPDTLEVTGLSLQQLFVQLVGSENPS